MVLGIETKHYRIFLETLTIVGKKPHLYLGHHTSRATANLFSLLLLLFWLGWGITQQRRHF